MSFFSRKKNNQPQPQPQTIPNVTVAQLPSAALAQLSSNNSRDGHTSQPGSLRDDSPLTNVYVFLDFLSPFIFGWLLFATSELILFCFLGWAWVKGREVGVHKVQDYKIQTYRKHSCLCNSNIHSLRDPNHLSNLSSSSSPHTTN